MANSSDTRSKPSVLGMKISIPLLLLILAVGFNLRAKGITWGLPEVHPYLSRSMDALHPDESVLVQEATDLRNKGLFHIETLRYPPLHAQLTALTEKWGSRSGQLWQRFLVARGVSIAAALGSLILLYFIGLHWGPSVALMASAFLSVSMISVRESHWANPESLSGFWVLAAFLLLLRIERSQRKSLYVLMGVVLALGIASKYFAALFVHLPLLAIFLTPRTGAIFSVTNSQGRSLRTALRYLCWAYASFAVACFLLLGIFIVRNPHMFLDAYKTHSLWAGHNGLYGIFPQPVSVPSYIATILPIALSPPVYWLAIAGMILSITQRKRLETALVAGILPFWIFLEMLRYHPLRFALSLAPVLCLFAALFFNLLFSYRRKLLSALGIALFSAVLIYSGIYTLGFISVLQPRDDARLLAADWIATHTSGTQQVVVLGVDLQSNSLGFIRYDGMDRLAGTRYDLASNLPEFVIIPKHVAHIFDQYERLTAAGYGYSASDWAPMNAPSDATITFYSDVMKKNTYRRVIEFDSVPHVGPLVFYSDPLKFDLSLTNLEVCIYKRS